MLTTIRVHVVKFQDRKNLMMRYTDPVTMQRKTRSTGTSNRRQAEREAAKWEAELQEGRYKPPSRITWEDFRERYETEHLPGLAKRTAERAGTVCNWVENIINPKYLSAITSDHVSKIREAMRKEGLQESTIKGNLMYLRSILNWAKRHGLIHTVPNIDLPKRAGQSQMKGRPITGEEFDRMVEQIGEVLNETVKPSWEHLLRGLWWSGLRLSEALNLSWDIPGTPQVDTSDEYPMILIPAEMDKGNRDRLLPIAPEFAEMLLAVPVEDRTGYVFNPQPLRRRGARMGRRQVSSLISTFGEEAGVKVNEFKQKDSTRIKYASAHDFRRSFGERWAQLVPPQVLMQLMRHEDIKTTMDFYVGRNALTVSKTLYSVVSGQQSVTIDEKADSSENSEDQKPSVDKQLSTQKKIRTSKVTTF